MRQRLVDEVLDLAAVADEADVLDDPDAGVIGVLELGEHEQRVGLYGPAAVDDRVVAGQVGELGRRLADDELARPVEHEAEGAVVGVLADEHDGAGEVRVRERGPGDQQLSAQGVDPSFVPVPSNVRATFVVTLTLTLLLRRGGAGERAADANDETQPADYDELAEDTVYPPPKGTPAPVA